MKKKIYISCLSILFSFLAVIVLPQSNGKIVDNEYNDGTTISEMIYNNMSEVDNYINSLYGNKDSFLITTLHNYGVLSITNVDQSRLKAEYNALGNSKLDLNSDHKIDDYDKLDRSGKGICQPTAVTMALKYMYVRSLFDYTPRVNNDKNDVKNIFYEVVDAYIQNKWKGSDAERKMCSASLNTFFKNHNSAYKATYTTSGLLNKIDGSYDLGLPSIAHISSSSLGHAVTICGYYIKRVTYLEDPNKTNSKKTIDMNFIVINTGWEDANIEENGGVFSNEEYEKNYSYIELKNIDAITYIR